MSKPLTAEEVSLALGYVEQSIPDFRSRLDEIWTFVGNVEHDDDEMDRRQAKWQVMLSELSVCLAKYGPVQASGGMFTSRYLEAILRSLRPF